MPYDFERLTIEKVRNRVWNKEDSRLFTPRPFGWGYTINFYTLFNRRTKLSIFVCIIFILIISACILGISQIILLNKAHSSFTNYYNFRGCTQLVEKTNSYGICKLGSGQTIKIVKYDNKWYLNKDLPICIGHTCL